VEGQVSLRVAELEMKVSLTVEAAPMWVSPTHTDIIFQLWLVFKS
jgi:hypothetical protein